MSTLAAAQAGDEHATPIFAEPSALTLLEVRRFAGSDNVLLRYAVAQR